jgi:DNA-binding transcriptional LysR family regulator
MNRNIDVAVARAFLAVIETGSVTLAARQLNLTQGAISQQLRRLEESADHALFVRAGRRLVPTSEGRTLVPTVRQFVAANEQLVAALRQPAFAGEVKLGVPYDIIGSYAPAILRRFGRAFPGIRVTLVCKDTVVLLRELKAGAIDLALTTELGCGKDGETLRSDRLAWIGARAGDAHTRDPLPVSLGAETCVFRPVAIAALRKARRSWQAVCEVSNMEPVRATLEADLAVAPLLGHSIPESLEVIAADRRLPRLPMFRINLYEARQPSPAARAFADVVRRSIASGAVEPWASSQGWPCWLQASCCSGSTSASPPSPCSSSSPSPPAASASARLPAPTLRCGADSESGIGQRRRRLRG